MKNMKNEETELLAITSGDMHQPYRYTIGTYGARFFQEIIDHKRFIGTECPRCGRVYVPPRKVCGRCFVGMDKFVRVAAEGEIVACAIIEFGFVDPETGIQRPSTLRDGIHQAGWRRHGAPPFHRQRGPRKGEGGRPGQGGFRR